MKKTFFKSIAALLTVTLALTMLSVTAFADDSGNFAETGLYFEDFESGNTVALDETRSGEFLSCNANAYKAPTVSTTDVSNINAFTGLLAGTGKLFSGAGRNNYNSVFGKNAWGANSDQESATGMQWFYPTIIDDIKTNSQTLKTVSFDTTMSYSQSYRGFIAYRWNSIKDYSAFCIYNYTNQNKIVIENWNKTTGNNPTSTTLASVSLDVLNKAVRIVLVYNEDGTVSLNYYNPDTGLKGSVTGSETVNSDSAYFGVTSTQYGAFYMDNLGITVTDGAAVELFEKQYADMFGYVSDPSTLPEDTSDIEKMMSLANWNYNVLPESSKATLSGKIAKLNSLSYELSYKNNFVNNVYTLDFENGELLKHDTDKSGVFTAQNNQSFVNTNADNPYSDDYNSSAKIAKFATHQEGNTAFKNGQLQFLTPDVWSIADYKNLTLTSANLDMVINTGIGNGHIIIYKYKDKENFAFWSLGVAGGTDGTDMNLGIRNYEVTSEILEKVNNGELTQLPFEQFLNCYEDNKSKGFSNTAWSNVGIAYEDDGNVKLTVKRVDGAEFTFDSAYDLDSINERYLALSDTSHATTYVDNVSLSFAKKSEFYKPQAVSATIRANSYADGNTQGLRFKYRLPYEIPEGSTLVEYGAVATAYKTGMDITKIVVDAENTITAKNTAPASDCLGKEFYATVTGITAENTTKCYIARSYVVYKDANGITTTVYSDNTTADGDYSKRTGCVDGCIVRSVASIAKAMVKAVYANKDNLTIEGNIEEIYDGSKFLSAATADNGAGIINFIVANKAAIEAVSK